MPLWTKICAVIAATMAIWMFAVYRHPRDWRRLLQDTFLKGRPVSVNVNKRLDEIVKRWAVNLLALFIACAVGFMITGLILKRNAQQQYQYNPEDVKRGTESLERLRARVEKEEAEQRLQDAALRPDERP
jgi:hypothetical protein